ncbi:CAP-associated domain-containing protein [Carnobacterium mobile]|uniref:CAP-associated domain-containing protein n=1 Tax=Carnobacterium mobile TaxID=2750 RepID=UPI001865A576|nr:CAP-associated domain-containing protein [Carnobacterium mobile]
MKTILRAVPIFLLLMAVTYLVPQITSEGPSEIITQKNKAQEVKKENAVNQPATFKQEKIPLSGIGLYIGQPVEKIQEEFGEPLRIDPTLYGYDWWVYGENEQDYFQVGVSADGKITNIFVLGAQLDASPFKIGMDITEIYQLTMFYPTFSIDYQEDTYTLELSENDLNYHPLIPFENQTFAILMFDRKTNEVNAIRYLDKRSLLQLGVYEITSQTPIPAVEYQENVFKEVYKSNQQEILTILNSLRQRYEVPVLTYDTALTNMANDIFTYQAKQLAEEAHVNNKEESSLQDDAQSKDDGTGINEHEIDEYPLLTTDLIQEKLKLEEVPLADTRVLYSNQSADSTWNASFWFSIENQRILLMDPNLKRIGIAFRGQEVLLILDRDTANSVK